MLPRAELRRGNCGKLRGNRHAAGELLSMNEGSRAQRKGRTGAAAAAMFGIALPQAASAAGQLVLTPDLPILVGLIVLFLVLVLPVNQLLFKPIFRVLDERERRIAGTRTHAEQLEEQAQQSLERCQSALRSVREEAEQARRSLLESARGDALEASNGARAEVERRLESARAEIDSSLDAARATLRMQSQELAREAASRVLGRAL